ncbi:MAG: SLATT domain-containing protein [Deltaproteobacteria bacterium]|nr:SLATT domain-containing protein [Deltaproteobacteria bacterium]MBI3390890.1 SLATT domain-containing protein [Deltaproteobacteria bacterium]
MSTNIVDEMRAEAARIEEDSLYSGKGHFEAARAWGNVHLWLGIPAAVLAAIASASAFKQEVALAGALALTASVLSAISTFLNASERSQLHHQAGVKHNALRNRARIFRELDLKSGVGPSDLLASLKALAQERDDLNLSSPQIPKFAFRRARGGIETGEAAYKVDSAITGAPGGKSGGA